MGNPESYLGRTLSWEGKQLTSVIDGTHSYSYFYNEDGLRLRKVVDGTDTEYYYNGLRAHVHDHGKRQYGGKAALLL